MKQLPYILVALAFLFAAIRDGLEVKKELRNPDHTKAWLRLNIFWVLLDLLVVVVWIYLAFTK